MAFARLLRHKGKVMALFGHHEIVDIFPDAFKRGPGLGPEIAELVLRALNDSPVRLEVLLNLLEQVVPQGGEDLSVDPNVAFAGQTLWQLILKGDAGNFHMLVDIAAQLVKLLHLLGDLWVLRMVADPLLHELRSETRVVRANLPELLVLLVLELSLKVAEMFGFECAVFFQFH